MISVAIFLTMLQVPNIPNQLKPWVPWVTHGQNHLNCPVSFSDGNLRFCEMHSPLSLELNQKGGNFSFTVEAYHKIHVELPSFDGGWPQSFQVNRRPYPVLDVNGKPYVILETGTHSIKGTFAWEQLPHSLSISKQVPTVFLVLNGEQIDVPNRKEPGKIWLSEPVSEIKSEDHVFCQVFRLWKDGNPTFLITKIQLSVAGKVQNWHFRIPMPRDFHLSHVGTSLPFQIESDHLNVQLRPGEWEITLEGLSSQHMTEVVFPAQAAPWPEQEILSFQSSPSIRRVEVQGLQSLDPSQIPLPEKWKNHPCYIMKSQFDLVEKMRGGDTSEIPEVHMSRTIWLDQDGSGFSFSDHLSGSLPKAFFFTLEHPFQMGSVTESGENLLITMSPEDKPGIEVRRKEFQLDIESRIPTSQRKLPASGLNTTVKNIQGTLNLPPGWQLLFARGPLQFTSTWISQWNLFDFFIFILLCFSFSKLWNRNLGILIGVCLFLCYQENDLPPFFWVSLAITTALAVYLPKGKLQSLASALRNLNLIVLLFLIFAFSASHLRTSIYPHLKTDSYSGRQYGGVDSYAAIDNLPQAAMVLEEKSISPKRKMKMNVMVQQSMPSKKIQLYSQAEAVQTGYGLPTWSNGPQSHFSADAPIKPGQFIRLFLLSPTLSLFLTLIQMALLFAVLKALWKLPERKQILSPQTGPLSTALVIALVFLGSSFAKAQFPDKNMLDALKERITTAPECLPYCAQYQSIALNIQNDQLKIEVLIHAQDRVTVPLPGSFSEWLPHTISNRGKELPAFLSVDGSLWISVDRGVNTIDLIGPLPKKSAFSINFPLSPHNLEIQAESWTYETPAGANQENSFVRFFKVTGEGTAPGLPKGDKLAPFFTVERHISMNQKWNVHTLIRRRGDSKLSLLLEIPLIKGEAVTTKQIQVKEGMAYVQIPSHRNSVSWDSALPITELIALRAMEENWYSEEWHLKYAPTWYVQTSGITPFSQFNSSGELAPIFRPWPGEALVVTTRQHTPSPGPTSTIDSITLHIAPGRKVSEESMNVSLKTSKGEIKSWKLPENIQVKSLLIDGRQIPFKLNNQLIDIPLNPGSHKIELDWEREINLGIFFSSPEIEIGEPSLNNRVTTNFPRNRWIFAVMGPSQGPVLLFWSHVLFFLLVSYFLSKIPWVPLKFHQWFLLGLGLDQVHISITFFIYFWIIAIGYRNSREPSKKAWRHNLGQVALVIMSFFAALAFLESIRHGLLSSPQMGITGNGSYHGFLAWYQERPEIPGIRIFSLPLWFYRICMLFWALWMARFLTGKAIWFWECLQKGGLWRAGSLKLKEPRPRRSATKHSDNAPKTLHTKSQNSDTTKEL